MKRVTTFLAILTLFLISAPGKAQVTVSPTTLFIDGKSQFETFIVMNGTDVAQEVSLEYQFGYPDADSLGNIFINYEDRQMEEKYSIADWIRGFPRNFIIEPGQRRVVRLTVRPQKQLPEGMYWARIKTRSTPVSPEIGMQQQSGITTQITVQFEQVTPVFYKVGNPITGINIRDVRVVNENGATVVSADVERLGNAPYLGTVTMNILDENGNQVGEVMNLVSVYFDRKLRLALDTGDLPAGRYQSNIRFESHRNDIGDHQLVQSEPVNQTLNFTIH